MEGFIHTIPRIAQNHALSNGNGGCIIQEFRSRGDIVYEEGDFSVVLKKGPYAEHDCMVIYSGPDTSVARYSDLSATDKKHFVTLVGGIADHFYKNFYSSIHELGDNVLSVGINTSMRIESGAIQSVKRPHMHITVFPEPREAVYRNKILTTRILIDEENPEHIARFCIYEVNKILGEEFRNHFGSSFLLNESGVFTTEIGLPNKDIIFCDENRIVFEELYVKCQEFLDKREHLLNPNMTGYSMSFVSVPRYGWKLRIAFFQKGKPTDSSGIAESGLHALDRIVTPYYHELPCQKHVRKGIESIFTGEKRVPSKITM